MEKFDQLPMFPKTLELKVVKKQKTKKVKPKKANKKEIEFVKNKPFDGEKLKRLMIDVRWNNDNESIANAAKKAGISKSGWQKVEANGMCKPDILGKICNHLKVPVQFFYS